MKYENIIKRPNGKRVKITSHFYCDHVRGPQYTFTVEWCEKGKRKWRPSFDGNDFSYRRLNIDDRLKYELQKNYEHVTVEEVGTNHLALWKRMKPVDF